MIWHAKWFNDFALTRWHICWIHQIIIKIRVIVARRRIWYLINTIHPWCKKTIQKYLILSYVEHFHISNITSSVFLWNTTHNPPIFVPSQLHCGGEKVIEDTEVEVVHMARSHESSKFSHDVSPHLHPFSILSSLTCQQRRLLEKRSLRSQGLRSISSFDWAKPIWRKTWKM